MRIKLYKPLQIFELGKRDNQEDALFPSLGEANSSNNLFIVCDGMGGHEHGEVASNTIANALSEEILKRYSEDEVFEDHLFYEALNEAYLKLDEQDKGRRSNMGTTMVMVLFHRGGAFVANIGDSRIYHIRPSENKILYKSRDHSLVFELFQAGEITKEEMATHPRRNVITRAMKPGEDSRSEADITHITDVCPGDFFYLCSDGMIESMTDEEILSLLTSDMSNEDRIIMLTQATVDNSDNHTAYLLQVDNVMLEQNDSSLLNDEQTVRWNALRYENRKIQASSPITPPPFKPQSKNSVTIVASGDVASREASKTEIVASASDVLVTQEDSHSQAMPSSPPNDPYVVVQNQQEIMPSHAPLLKKSNKLWYYGLILAFLCTLIAIAFLVFNKCSDADEYKNHDYDKKIKLRIIDRHGVIESYDEDQKNQFHEQQEEQQQPKRQIIQAEQGPPERLEDQSAKRMTSQQQVDQDQKGQRQSSHDVPQQPE